MRTSHRPRRSLRQDIMPHRHILPRLPALLSTANTGAMMQTDTHHPMLPMLLRGCRITGRRLLLDTAGTRHASITADSHFRRRPNSRGARKQTLQLWVPSFPKTALRIGLAPNIITSTVHLRQLPLSERLARASGVLVRQSNYAPAALEEEHNLQRQCRSKCLHRRCPRRRIP